MRPIAFLLVSSLSLFSQTPKALIYMRDNPASVRAFAEHAGKIDIIVPTSYAVDEKGAVKGSPSAALLEAARKAGVKLMPIIVNPGFNQEKIHELLTSEEAQRAMNARLVEECRKHSLYGIQFDFENVPATDRALLSAAVKRSAAALGEAGFKLSIATVPSISDDAPEGDYAKWMYANWRGAFDLAALAASVDFISLMTYDQHTRHTPPGPVAGYQWMEAHMQHALTMVPREKLSLGIPFYGRRWMAGMRNGEASVVVRTVTGVSAPELAQQMKTVIQWDQADRAPWFVFHRDGNREYVYFDNARSFKERYDLAAREKLHGFSSWVLGMEDPAIWNVLPDTKK